MKTLYSIQNQGQHIFPFDPIHTALLVIDMQNDFCHPQGWYPTLSSTLLTRRPIQPITHMLSFAREQKMMVVFTREGHQPDLTDLSASKRARYLKAGKTIGDAGPLGRLLVCGEYGHAIIDELQPLPGEAVLDKTGHGAFYGTPLDLILRDHSITHLLITGVTTECCVSSTMREANDRGYWCLLLEDCCAAFTEREHEDSVELIRQGSALGWTALSTNIKPVLLQA